MQAWFAVHGALLRDMACQDAMWARAVEADAPTAEDSANDAAAPAREQFVQEFSTEGPARLQSQQSALDALAAERARQYRVTCEQVCCALCLVTHMVPSSISVLF